MSTQSSTYTEADASDVVPATFLSSDSSFNTLSLEPSASTLAHILTNGLESNTPMSSPRKSSNKSKKGGKVNEDMDERGTHVPFLATSLPYRFNYYSGEYSLNQENGRERIFPDIEAVTTHMMKEGLFPVPCPIVACDCGIQGSTQGTVEDPHADIGALRNHAMSHLDIANRLFNPEGSELSPKELRARMKGQELYIDNDNHTFSRTRPDKNITATPDLAVKSSVSSYVAPVVAVAPVSSSAAPVVAVTPVATYGASPAKRVPPPSRPPPVPTVVAPWIDTGVAMRNSIKPVSVLSMPTPTRSYGAPKSERPVEKRTPRVNGPTTVALFDLEWDIPCELGSKCMHRKTTDEHLPSCGFLHPDQHGNIHRLTKKGDPYPAFLCKNEQPHLCGKLGRDARCQDFANCGKGHLKGHADAVKKAIERHMRDTEMTRFDYGRLQRCIEKYQNRIESYVEPPAPAPAPTRARAVEDWTGCVHAPGKTQDDIVYAQREESSEESEDEDEVYRRYFDAVPRNMITNSRPGAPRGQQGVTRPFKSGPPPKR